MHLLHITFGLIIFTNCVNSLPKIDPIAYHQSIFKHTTQEPKQNDNEKLVSNTKSDPLQSIMRFFDNMSFMKTLGQMFDQPRLQAAPKVQQPHAIKIKQFAEQGLQQNDEPINDQFSIDEPSQSKDEEVSTGIGNFEWKHLLLGPDGVLTSIFNDFKERHKMEAGKVEPNVPQADLTPEQNDFAKLFESFLLKAKNGNFDEPLPELPFIGICNRVNCGDIYKAVDEFRKSEFFSNFQTAISLLHDPKGLDIIGEVLANPELIENFVGKNAGGGTFPQIMSGNKTLKKVAKDDLTSEDGDFGVDFSAIEDGKQIGVVKNVGTKMPTISANLDYYSSVDTDSGKVEKEEKISDHIDIEEVIMPKINSSLPQLPEISESIDSVPQDYEVAVVEETIPIPKQEIQIGKISQSTTTTTQFPKTTTQLPKTIITTKLPIYTTTRKNFRVKDPYYAIYYDDV